MLPHNPSSAGDTLTGISIITGGDRLSDIPFSVEAVARAVLALKQIETAQLEFNFVDNPTLHRMNREFLNHDYETDIITFDMSDEDGTLAGDIYISVDQARLNAAEYGNSPEQELKLLIIHGILHLLGYDDISEQDRAEMQREQDHLLETINL